MGKAPFPKAQPTCTLPDPGRGMCFGHCLVAPGQRSVTQVSSEGHPQLQDMASYPPSQQEGFMELLPRTPHPGPRNQDTREWDLQETEETRFF